MGEGVTMCMQVRCIFFFFSNAHTWDISMFHIHIFFQMVKLAFDGNTKTGVLFDLDNALSLLYTRVSWLISES